VLIFAALVKTTEATIAQNASSGLHHIRVHSCEARRRIHELHGFWDRNCHLHYDTTGRLKTKDVFRGNRCLVITVSRRCLPDHHLQQRTHP